MRVKSLDGLRGIAIAFVLAFHFCGFSIGWIGVDLFFALSGYLITTILLDERNEKRFWSMFWTRRVTRILPPLLLTLIVSFVSLRFPAFLWPYFLFFGANIAQVKYAGLLNIAGLNALWSLAVEEHFYLIWPACVRWMQRRTLVWLLGCIVLLEPAARLIALSFGMHPKHTMYFLTPFRLDGLSIGALLAVAFKYPAARLYLDRHISRFGLAAAVLFACTAFYMKYDTYVLFCAAAGYSILAWTSTTLIAHLVLRPASLVSLLLSFRPLTILGRISYGAYLFHYLVRNIMVSIANRHGYYHNARIGYVSIFVTICLAWLSFRIYETPFLSLGKRLVHSYKSEEKIVATA